MAVTPFLSGDTSKTMIQLIYSILFFAVAFYVSLSPEKLTHLLGRFTSPCLLILIGIMFVGCLLAPPAGYGESYGLYAQSPVLQGFLGGYQTMDAIAALNFGIIIAMNINNRGVTERSAVVKEITYAGMDRRPDLPGGIRRHCPCGCRCPAALTANWQTALPL